MTDILKMDKLHKDAPIMVTSIPKLIMDEIDEWVVECRKIKDHPLSELKSHENVGSPTNTYQTSVPSHLIENSFWLAWVLRLTSKYWREEIDVTDDLQLLNIIEKIAKNCTKTCLCIKNTSNP